MSIIYTLLALSPRPRFLLMRAYAQQTSRRKKRLLTICL